MKTGFSLCSISNREKPVFINLEPCNENRFFPVWKYYKGKTLFWPCTGPVRDCSVTKQGQKKENKLIWLELLEKTSDRNSLSDCVCPNLKFQTQITLSHPITQQSTASAWHQIYYKSRALNLGVST